MSAKTEMKAKLRAHLEAYVQSEISSEKGLTEGKIEWRNKVIDTLCGDADLNLGTSNTNTIKNWLRKAGVDLVSKTQIKKDGFVPAEGEAPFGKIRPVSHEEEAKMKSDKQYKPKFLEYEVYVKQFQRFEPLPENTNEQSAPAPGKAA